jgi:hypothetical protein
MGLRALLALGFIAKTRRGGIAQGKVVCTLYRFTDEPMWEFPKLGIGPMSPTNEWARFTTLADARAALRSADISEPALHPKAQGLGREEKPASGCSRRR